MPCAPRVPFRLGLSPLEQDLIMSKGKSKNSPRRSTPAPSAPPGDGSGENSGGEFGLLTDTSALPQGPTGRSLVVLRPEGEKSLLKALKNTTGLSVASTADFEGAVVKDKDSLLLEHLDIAVIDGDPDQVQSLAAAVADESSPVLSIEPEMYVIPFADSPLPPEFLTEQGRAYLQGYADAVEALCAGLAGYAEEAGSPDLSAAATFADSGSFTWGLQATRVTASGCTGSGIRVAVLDTGMDLQHPDFVGRSILSASFVPGETVQDGHSHGTHCIGTACGPRTSPGRIKGYGVASDCAILAGKVLSNAGGGQGGWILAGINWAIQNQAVVISMSLGSAVGVGQGFSAAYEQAALAALNKNSLIVAAAGNSGNTPVGSPANCPSVLAVGSLDPNLQRSSFSCIAMNTGGGELDLAAPGREVYSAVPMPARYGLKSGTSMATPHVAGIAALLAQNTGLRGKALWQKLVATAASLSQTAQFVGAGLAIAPPCGKKKPAKKFRFPFFGQEAGELPRP